MMCRSGSGTAAGKRFFGSGNARCGSQRLFCDDGFTLVEILVAIFIFAIVLSSLYGSYSSSFRLIGATRSQAEVYQMARVAMERISEDLSATVSSRQQWDDTVAGDVQSFVGLDENVDGRAADSLRFRSRAQLFRAGADVVPGGLSVISYAVHSAEDGGGLVLYRHAISALATDSGVDDRGFILCDHLAGVNFTYFDESGELYESWDSGSELFRGWFPARALVELDFWEDGIDSSVIKFRTSVVLPSSGNREKE